MNYIDNDNNDYMRHLVVMASNIKYYTEDLESFLYDMVQLVIQTVSEMVPSLVMKTLQNNRFDITIDTSSVKKNIEDAFRF